MTESKPLVLTKLQPPYARGRILRRERLLNILRNNTDKKLILVCADAGYGKTTLLSQFCEELSSPFFFYNLDTHDNDVATFLRYVAEGMNRHASGFGERLASIIPYTRDVQITVGTFINVFMEKFKDDFFFILDDYHHILHNREIASMIDYLLHNAPVNLHVIIASRATPRLSLDYLSAKQELLKIEKEQLRFTTKELQSLLWDVYGLKIPGDTVGYIEEHAEGWITAIQLILQKLSAIGGSRASEAFNNYITSGEDIFNYFAGEVFESQPAEIRKFLMHTSILDFLSVDVCNRLLQTRRSEKVLGYLEHEHIFVTRVGSRYTYHPLFHDFLLRRLREYYPSRTIKRLYYTLGNFYLTNRELTTAVSYFLKAENYGRAAGILEKNYRVWRFSGEYSSYVSLIDGFPETVIADYPGLILKKARMLLYLGRIDQAMKIIKPIIAVFHRRGNVRILSEAYYILGSLYLYIAEPQKALILFKKALQLTSKNDIRRKIEILVSFGNSYRLLSKFSMTERYLGDALAIARRIGDFELEIQVLKNLAYLYWAMCNYKKAEEVFREIFSQFESGKIFFELGKMYADAAMVNIYNYHLVEADANLGRAQEFANRYNDHSHDIYRLFAQGDLFYAQRNYIKAIECYRGILGMVPSNEKLFKISVLLSITMTYLQMGRITESEKTMRELEPLLTARTPPAPLIEYYLVGGDIQQAKGQHRNGLRYYDKALKKAVRFDQAYMRMRVFYKMSGTYLALNDRKEAMSALEKAVTIARDQEYDAFLIYEGHIDIALIEFGLKNDICKEYLTGIVGSIESYEAKRLLNTISVAKGMVDLECGFLGELTLRDGQGRAVAPNWRTKNARTMFVFLVVNQQNGCTKDQFIDAFWPDKDLHDASHSLQVEISSLRSLIKEMSKTVIPAKQLIVYRNRRYYFNPAFVVKTDLQQFDAIVKDAEMHEKLDRAYSIRLYEKALEMYRGDFCGEAIDDWTSNIRSYYREATLKICKKIAVYLYEAREYNKSVRCYTRALQFDPYDENTHIGIMRCYSATGDRKGIRKQFEMLSSSLKELGIDKPSDEAIQIYQKSLK
jgi:ATP/maltotriose-dependent transcriptional regulator MalT/two-component SAPR family response regulator